MSDSNYKYHHNGKSWQKHSQHNLLNYDQHSHVDKYSYYYDGNSKKILANTLNKEMTYGIYLGCFISVTSGMLAYLLS